jgi:hypothetical protein
VVEKEFAGGEAVLPRTVQLSRREKEENPGVKKKNLKKTMIAHPVNRQSPTL